MELEIETKSMEVTSGDDEILNIIQDSPFHNVPVEVFLHICSFLDIQDAVITLGKVCKRFAHILSDENLWKYRFGRRWTSGHIVHLMKDEEESEFDWKNACYVSENEFDNWKEENKKFDHMVVCDCHISSIDALLLLESGKICVSGSRDRSIAVWNAPRNENEKPVFTQKQLAHDGWIWEIVNAHDTIFSCSWDNTIKSWSLNSQIKLGNTFR